MRGMHFLGVERTHDLGEVVVVTFAANGDAVGRELDELAEAAQDLGERTRCSGSAGTTSTVGRPISAFSAPGVPSATIRPWSMIPTRSARTSASSRYCVVRKMVTPSSFASRATSCQSAFRLCGSSPVVGSSRKSSRGSVHEREGEIEAPLHPARVRADAAVGGEDEADALEQLVSALGALMARYAVQRGLEAQVVAAGEQRIERRLLQRGADRRSHLRPLLDDVEAGDPRRACRRWQQRRQHVDGRRLPGTVRAEKPVDLAGRDGQVDPVDRAHVLELPDEPLRLDAVPLRHPSPTLPTSAGGTPARRRILWVCAGSCHCSCSDSSQPPAEGRRR